VRISRFFAALALAFTAVPAAAQSPLEEQVLAVLNMARTNPQAFAQTLRTFRGYFQKTAYVLPGSNVLNMTEEGVGAVDEAIAFLDRQKPLKPVSTGLVLAAAAADHAAEQGADGSIGHGSADGSGPAERVQRRGGGDYVAEVIEYGAIDAVDAVRQLIVDDGVADRGHRTVLFDASLRFAGVSCGKHPSFRHMCVIDLGVTGDGRWNGRMEMASAGGGFGGN